jgi:ribosomal protein S18 acetylase RimI-like enzyme
VHVERATQASHELLDALKRLLPQLSPERELPTTAQLKELLAAHGSVLLLAREQGRIVGTATLVTFRTTTGLRARIEDAVVDESARGRGAGAALIEETLRLAREKGASHVSLTSRTEREGANRLYRRLGFDVRDTNVFVYRF